LVLPPHPTAGIDDLRGPGDRTLAQSGSSPVASLELQLGSKSRHRPSRCGYGSALVAVYVWGTTVIVLATCWPDRSAGTGVTQRDVVSGIADRL